MSIQSVLNKYSVPCKPGREKIADSESISEDNVMRLVCIPVPNEEQLIKQFTPLAHKQTKKYCPPHISYEDMYSVVLYGVLEGIRTFNSSKGCKMVTHVQNRIVFAIQHWTRQDTGIIHLPYSVNTNRDNPDVLAKIPQRVVANDDDWMPEPVQGDFSQDLHESMDMESALSILNDTECNIIMMRCKGSSVREITEVCGFSQVKINKIYNSAIEKMQKFLTERDLVSV